MNYNLDSDFGPQFIIEARKIDDYAVNFHVKDQMSSTLVLLTANQARFIARSLLLAVEEHEETDASTKAKNVFEHLRMWYDTNHG